MDILKKINANSRKTNFNVFDKDHEYFINDLVYKNSSAVLDLFFNSFDITWAHDEKYNGQYIFTKIPPEDFPHNSKQVIDDGSVTYKYNSDYFRCDEFTKEHDGKHVLFAGCSETEGVGGNLDECWAFDLYKKLSVNNKLSGYFNLGKAGFGWQKIINNINVYIDKYGVPDYLFIMLPNVTRYYSWNEDLKTWFYEQKIVPNCFKQNNKNKKTEWELGNLDNKKMLIDFIVSWKMFEKYCSALGIKLLWSTWEPADACNFTLGLNLFNNFYSINLYDVEDFIIKNDLLSTPSTLFAGRKRDGHSGPTVHQFWAWSFFNTIKELWGKEIL